MRRDRDKLNTIHKQIISRGALLVLLALLLAGCSRKDMPVSASGREVLSKETIIAEGKKIAGEMELPTGDAKILYDDANSKWEAWLARFRQTNKAEALELEHFFAGREYQAVYIDFGPDILDADCWLLVDKYSGEAIITVQDFSEEGHQTGS